MDPLFSIITTTYNCGAKLDGTLESVMAQDFKDFEYLIVDGNSKDGLQERLAQIKDLRIRSWSEPDKGIYDAMNKGIQHARGRYLIFLGAGDKLFPGVLQQISQDLPKEDMAIIYGNVLWDEKIYDGEFTKLKLSKKNICHQAIFYTRNIFDTVGDYDLKYRSLADWVLNMKCFGDSRIIIRYVPITVSIFEVGGVSGIGDTSFYADRSTLIWRHLGIITYAQFSIFVLKSRLISTVRPFVPSAILRARRKISQCFPGH
jgi:glycosyltransferase involved in cell wall biosynthesis